MISRLSILLFVLLIFGCSTEPEDCTGVEGGKAQFDNCGVCSGGLTGITANTDHNNFVLDPSITIITITDTDFNNVRKIKVISSFSTSSLTEHIDIYSYYTMDVSLSAKFRRILGE